MTNLFGLLPPLFLIEKVGPLLDPGDLSKFATVLKFKITEHMPEKVEGLIRMRLQTLVGAINTHPTDRIVPLNTALQRFQNSLAGLPTQFHKNYTVVHMATGPVARNYSHIRYHMVGDLHGGRGVSHTVLLRMPLHLAFSPVGGEPTTHALRYLRLSWTDNRLSFDPDVGFDIMTGPLPRAADLPDLLWVEYN
jgi:hypothetical protein